MGFSYLFTCKDCKYNQKLYEGWGFMVHDQSVKEYLDSKQDLVHYKTHKKIEELSSQFTDILLKMEYRIYRCNHCLQISDKLFVQVFQDEKILHQTRFRCMNCNTVLKHTNIHSLKYAICPRCKSPKFKKSKELMLWD